MSDDSHAYFLQQDVTAELKEKITQLSQMLKKVQLKLAKTESKISQNKRPQTIAKIQTLVRLRSMDVPQKITF